jgi:hypothetical protein
MLLVMLVLAAIDGVHHDYGFYELQWDAVLEGQDPWDMENKNAYGPIHNLLAILYYIWPLLPKVFFCCLLFVAGMYSCYPESAPLIKIPDEGTYWLPLGAIAFSPFTIITVATFGDNDIIPAASMAASLVIVCCQKNYAKRILSGSLLAIGTLCKIYPVIIFPFVFIRNRNVDWAVAIGFVGLFTFGILASYSIWGFSFLRPLLHASVRASDLMSFFNFLRMHGLNLDAYSTPAMILAFLTCMILFFWKNAPVVDSSIITFAIVLSLYKVGHQQFFLFFFLVAPFAIRFWTKYYPMPRNRIIVGSYLAWLSFLNWYQLEFMLQGGPPRLPGQRFFGYDGLACLAYALISLVALGLMLRVSISGNPADLAPDSLSRTRKARAL